VGGCDTHTMSRVRSRDTTTENIQPAEAIMTITTMPPFTGTSQVHGRNGSEAGSVYDESLFFLSYSGKVGRIETIEDVEGSSRSAYNACDHTKEEWDVPALPGFMLGDSSEYLGKYAQASTVCTLSAGPDQLEYGYSAFPSSWTDEANALGLAVNKMRFGIQDSGFNLPTFLGELKDFKHLFSKNAGKLSHNSKRLPTRKGGKYPEGFDKKTLSGSIRDGLVGLLKADLTNQFVVKPMVADIQKMMTLGRHLAAQKERLTGGKPVVVRSSYKDRTEVKDDFLDPSVYTHGWVSNRVYERTITPWALIKYDSDALPDLPEVLLLADMLGFDQPLSTVWELIPFSFMVDYFIRVGDWLDQFDGQVYDVPYTILQQGYSVKTVFRSEVKTTFNSGIYRTKYQNLAPLTRYGTMRRTRYRRVPGELPYGSFTTPTISLPSLRQAGNIVDIALLRILGS